MNALRLFLMFIGCIGLQFIAAGQQAGHSKPGMGAGKFNYTSFTSIQLDTTKEVIAGNKGYEHHPELGQLYKDAPCKDCYEAIGKRTATTKTYMRTGGKELLNQTSTAPMHYKDASGRWRTIRKDLQPQQAGLFAANEQEAPVAIDTKNGFSSLGAQGQRIQFNNNLELLYEQPDGQTILLGAADWQHYTAGDDGVYVTNAWPGIDIEMRTNRGTVKTNFWINHSLPAYAAGKLLVRDHMKMDSSLSLWSSGEKKYTGVLEVRNAAREKVYVISTATAFEKNDGQHTLRNLEYYIGDDNTVDIALPGDFLNRPASSYPVIIDPLVSLSTSVAVAGSTYSPGWTVGCAISNPATVPADITITDIQFTFEYLASGGALQTNGSMDFWLGTCRNPGLTGYYWYCLDFTPGLCGGSFISLISDYGPCIPPVSCVSYDLNMTMNFYQNYLSTLPCSNLYITASMPFTITVVGQVLNTTLSAPAAVCSGQSATITSTTTFGSPPYSYSWSPGGMTTSAVTVSPASTTTYTLVVTDACGFMDTATRTVTVNPSAPIIGTSSICMGTNTTFSNAIPGGTWFSSNPGIISISAAGVGSASALGSAVITYTTASGCASTLPVTVVTSTDAITGNTFLCTGTSTILSNTSTGGTWSSSNTAIATVDAAGTVNAVSAGLVVITYAVSAGCYSIFPMPIFATPAVSGTATTDPTTCISADGSITLNGLASGNTYTVSYLFNTTPVTATLTANATGQVIISNLDGGSYSNIILTSANGCVSSSTGPITLNFPPSPATPVVANNGPICAGDNVSLTATCATPGVTYSWSGPNGFTSTLQNPTIIPAYTINAGAYIVTATVIGCVSSPSASVMVIHPIPFINGMAGTNPTTCFGTDGTVILSGLIAGVAYLVDYSVNGIATSANITADALGRVIIMGLGAGTYSNISMSSFGCLSNTVGPVTLLDPGAPPAPTLSSNAPVCEGVPLALFATDSMPGVTYSWAGPNGFTSSLQNPVVYNTISAAAGTYTATVANSACSVVGSIAISLFPAVTLTNVTADQSVIFGTTVQLTASGALYYTWTPNNGSLNDPNISYPIAHPLANTTYLVSGMNEWGCVDTASVNIDITHTDTILIPTAFTPNGDGRNDVFKIANYKDTKLVEFSIFNRWGQVVYHNEWDITHGWDGTQNGIPADMGVYHYLIILARPYGENRVYKGDVTLIR